MLYDNAQLARVYVHAWQVTGKAFYRTIVEETLDYVVREMTDPAGGFYSTQDADSEGEEGKFFVWAPGEIRDVLGADADAFVAAYGVCERGNFEGKNILELVGSLEDRQALAEARQRLFKVRKQRVHPGRDKKILTSWNGLRLAAFAEAARGLGREDYREVAERNAGFLLSELRTDGGRLLIGDSFSEDTRALLAVLRDGYGPHQVVSLGNSDKGMPTVPLLRYRTPVDGRATTYVCVRMVCQSPVTDREESAGLLDR